MQHAEGGQRLDGRLKRRALLRSKLSALRSTPHRFQFSYGQVRWPCLEVPSVGGAPAVKVTGYSGPLKHDRHQTSSSWMSFHPTFQCSLPSFWHFVLARRSVAFRAILVLTECRGEAREVGVGFRAKMFTIKGRGRP